MLCVFFFSSLFLSFRRLPACSPLLVFIFNLRLSLYFCYVYVACQRAYFGLPLTLKLQPKSSTHRHTNACDTHNTWWWWCTHKSLLVQWCRVYIRCRQNVWLSFSLSFNNARLMLDVKRFNFFWFSMVMEQNKQILKRKIRTMTYVQPPHCIAF